MPYGYNGKILHIDLTKGQLTIEKPPEAFYRKYMGGSAMGLYYILKGMPAGVDPLAPENVLTFMLSVTTGAAISGQSRINVNAKSPMSGAMGTRRRVGSSLPSLNLQALTGLLSRDVHPVRFTCPLSMENQSFTMPLT